MAIATCIIFTTIGYSTADQSTQDDPAEDDQPPSTQLLDQDTPTASSIMDSQHPSAKQLLRDVLIQLPQEHLNINGDISVLKWGSGVQSKLRFTTSLNLSVSPSLAQYTILDTFGRELEQLTITRQKGEAPEFSYASGKPLVLRPTPNLSSPIRNTELTWFDLTLSFLWWIPEAEVDTDSIRNRDCYVIIVRRPNDQSDTPTDEANKTNTYTAAKLWVDKKAHVLLQAEAINHDNQAIRRLWVKSIKKVNGKWMIKDMEVAGSSADNRTRLTVRDVQPATDHDN